VGLIWWMMFQWGLLGAAFGLLSSNLILAAGLWIGFLALVPRTHDPTPMFQVLKKLTGISDSARWTVTRLGEGDHSNVYAVQSADGQQIWRSYDSFVVKLYKLDAGLTLHMVQEQFDSLARLHTALNGRSVNGWSISTPEPLHICEKPLSLVMSAVCGKMDLRSCAAADNDLTPEALDSLGRAFVATMRDSWARGQMHGDLGLQNILYDLKGKHLSFIDPGTPDCCTVCNDSTNNWHSPALELGHILRDLGTDMRDLIGDPIARLRRKIFVERALRAYIDTLPSQTEKLRALDEIKICARMHLSKVLEPSWSPRGILHWLLTQFVLPRMESTLDRLRVDLNYAARSASSPNLNAA